VKSGGGGFWTAPTEVGFHFEGVGAVKFGPQRRPTWSAVRLLGN
jgi:hypothetical protein